MALLAGCASLGPQLPAPTEDETRLDDIAFGVRTLGPNGEFELLSSAELARRLQAGLGRPPLSILAISSGGASGAFGAGALVGSTGSRMRPEFTVVTGVSVGALLSPFAFLGPGFVASYIVREEQHGVPERARRRSQGRNRRESRTAKQPRREVGCAWQASPAWNNRCAP